MITDLETNFVYFSSILKSNSKYKSFWKRLKRILDKESIDYSFINGTRDIWCRDYMPVQINNDSFMQFKFFPDYFLSPEHIHRLTIPRETSIPNEFFNSFSRLIIDGGNIVKSKSQVILTDKIFKENPDCLKSMVLHYLGNDLKIEKIHIIPCEPEEISGHADGMVRFKSENELLVSDYSMQNSGWRKKYETSLNDTGLNLIAFPAVNIEEKNDDGDYTAKGCYINFAQIGNKILLPFFDLSEDLLVEKVMKKLFPECKIIPVQSNEIAYEGGVLNCITWNIKL